MKREYKYETLYRRALEREEGINIIGCPVEDIRLIKKMLIKNFPYVAVDIIEQLDAKGKVPPYQVKYPMYEQYEAGRFFKADTVGFIKGFFIGKVSYRNSSKEYFFNEYVKLEELYNNIQNNPYGDRRVYTCFRLYRVVKLDNGKTSGENQVDEFDPLEMTMERLFGHLT